MPADSGAAGRAASRGPDDGTPEQIHLTWGDDPARAVVVSWASPGRAVAPRVRIGQRVIPAVERGYADPARRTGTRSRPTTTATRSTRSAPPSAPRPRGGRRYGSPASATWPCRAR